MLLKILQYSQENTYTGVSLRTFKSAILLKRDSKAYALNTPKFLRTPIFEEHLRTTASYFIKKYRQLKIKQLIQKTFKSVEIYESSVL